MVAFGLVENHVVLVHAPDDQASPKVGGDPHGIAVAGIFDPEAIRVPATTTVHRVHHLVGKRGEREEEEEEEKKVQEEGEEGGREYRSVRFHSHFPNNSQLSRAATPAHPVCRLLVMADREYDIIWHISLRYSTV